MSSYKEDGNNFVYVLEEKFRSNWDEWRIRKNLPLTRVPERGRRVDMVQMVEGGSKGSPKLGGRCPRRWMLEDQAWFKVE